jgi:hypothetical protein
MFPGVWFDAQDRSLRGAGNMRVAVDGMIPVAGSSGPEMDQGALMRILGEMVWFPTAFADDRHVAWAAIDDRRARAALRVHGREVACLFEFGPDALPAWVFADRYRDVGGKGVMTPWSGSMEAYREVDGLIVPHQLTAYWQVNGEPVAYARFTVERLEYDRPSPF